MDDRELARAVRQSADSGTARLNELPITRTAILTVASTGPTTVTWRGAAVPVAWKNANYTPTVGDRVRCSLADDGQLFIDYRIDATP